MSNTVATLSPPPSVSGLDESTKSTPRSRVEFAPLDKTIVVGATYRLRPQPTVVASWLTFKVVWTALLARNPHTSERPATTITSDELKLRQDLASYARLQKDWDGEGAKPPTKTAVNNALTFLDARPQDIPLPYPEEGTEGDVGVYWEFSDERVFAEVTFDGDGTCAYFAVHGVPGAVDKICGGSAIDVSAPWPDDMLHILRSRNRT